MKIDGEEKLIETWDIVSHILMKMKKLAEGRLK